MGVLRVFGSGGSEGWPCLFCECKSCSSGVEKKRCGHVIEIEGVSVWLDLSLDFRSQLLEYGRIPDYFFVSHAHSDHSGGLVELEQALFVTRNERGIVPNVIVPKHLHDHLVANGEKSGGHDEGMSSAYLNLVTKKRINSIIALPGEWIPLGRARAMTIDHPHGKLTSTSLVIEGEGKRFAYLTDMEPKGIEIVMRHVGDLDLVLANTPFLENTEKKHMSPRDLIPIRAKRIVCSHFTHKNSKTHEEISRIVENIDPRMVVAEDGMVFYF